jgi:hypothetical protein
MEYITNLHNLEEFQDFDNLELIAREVVEGFITGLHRSPFHGFSVEFSEHRQTTKGNRPKYRLETLWPYRRLYVKQFEEEQFTLPLVVDTSSSMLFPIQQGKSLQMNKLTFSVYCCAAYLHDAQAGGCFGANSFFR